MLTIKNLTNKAISNRWILLLFLMIHVTIAVFFIRVQNITYDEPGYIEYSKRWLHGNTERAVALDDSKTPAISIVWLPRIIRQVIHPNYQLNDYGRQDQREGRYMMLFFSVLTCIYLYKFCLLLKLQKWWVVFLFFIIDPLITAYSILINSDLLSGLLLLAIVYHLYKYFKENNHFQFYIACILLGVALVTKHTFLFAIPLLLLFSVLTNKKYALKQLLLAFLILLLVVNLAFYFQGTGKSLGSYQFLSTTFISLQQKLIFLSWLPVPLPYSYVQSIDLLQYHAQLGGSIDNTYTGVYLLSKTNLLGGFWYYYFVTAFYKFPVSILILVLVGLIWFVLKFRRINFSWYILIVPIIYFFGVLSFFNKFQIGIRHLIIVLPLLYVLIAVIINKILFFKKRWILSLLWVWMFASVMYYYPLLIPYTNELIVNKAKVFEKIMDSSIDYGQSDSAAVRFLKNNPAYKIPTSQPLTGSYLISMRTIVENQKFGNTSLNWLIQHYQPTGVLNFTHIQYDVK